MEYQKVAIPGQVSKLCIEMYQYLGQVSKLGIEMYQYLVRYRNWVSKSIDTWAGIETEYQKLSIPH